jgi:hypothetical protein
MDLPPNDRMFVGTHVRAVIEDPHLLTGRIRWSPQAMDGKIIT